VNDLAAFSWAWKFWRLAVGPNDGIIITDSSGEWLRLFGQTWWLAKRAPS
jgi:hypothetical protein